MVFTTGYFRLKALCIRKLCVFAEQTEGALKEKGVYVKMARGEMVRFMAEHNITRPEELKAFAGLGYRFSEEDSSPNRYVFKR